MLRLSPRKELCSSGATGPCTRGQKHGSSLAVCFVCFPDRMRRKRELWRERGCGAKSCGDGHGARLETSDSHSPTNSSCTACTPGKPVRGSSLSCTTFLWPSLMRAAHGLEALPPTLAIAATFCESPRLSLLSLFSAYPKSMVCFQALKAGCVPP